MTFDCDFADLFEARGQRRRARGMREVEVEGDGRVLFDYTGLDGVERSTSVSFFPKPARTETSSAYYDMTLQPQEKRVIFIRVSCNPGKDEVWNERPFFAAFVRVPPRAATRRQPAGPRHQLERAAAGRRQPLHGRSRNADDRNRVRPLSLCRHSVVLDGVRARRDHHRADDAVGRSGAGARRAEPPGGARRRRRSIRSAMPSPARSCTRRARARWPICARCRSAFTTAAWIRPRCS